MAPHSSTLAWKIPWMEEPGRLQSMGSQRVGHDFTFTFTFHFHALEKEMATHSSVLAWRIPGTGEPGGLPSMGFHRVGHDWSDLAAAAEWFILTWFRIAEVLLQYMGFPCGSAGKESACNAGDLGLIPGLGRSPGEGKRLPTPVFWPGEFHGLYGPWGHKELRNFHFTAVHDNSKIT